jgi:hypothetical protein
MWGATTNSPRATASVVGSSRDGGNSPITNSLLQSSGSAISRLISPKLTNQPPHQRKSTPPVRSRPSPVHASLVISPPSTPVLGSAIPPPFPVPSTPTQQPAVRRKRKAETFDDIVEAIDNAEEQPRSMVKLEPGVPMVKPEPISVMPPPAMRRRTSQSSTPRPPTPRLVVVRQKEESIYHAIFNTTTFDLQSLAPEMFEYPDVSHPHPPAFFGLASQVWNAYELYWWNKPTPNGFDLQIR